MGFPCGGEICKKRAVDEYLRSLDGGCCSQAGLARPPGSGQSEYAVPLSLENHADLFNCFRPPDELARVAGNVCRGPGGLERWEDLG